MFKLLVRFLLIVSYVMPSHTCYSAAIGPLDEKKISVTVRNPIKYAKSLADRKSSMRGTVVSKKIIKQFFV